MLSNAIFSVDLVDSGFESAQDFRDMVWGIMEGAGKFNVSDYFPMFRRFDLLGVKRDTFLSSYKRIYDVVDEKIKNRIKCRESDPLSRKNDFLDVLLDQCQEDGSCLSSENIKVLIVVSLKQLFNSLTSLVFLWFVWFLFLRFIFNNRF